jgi:hypothetical protein
MNYDWFPQDILHTCINRLVDLNISKECKFEVLLGLLSLDLPPEFGSKSVMIEGSIDCVDGNNIWEFKCVGRLRSEHIIQLSFYMFANEYEEFKNDLNRSLRLKTLFIDRYIIKRKMPGTDQIIVEDRGSDQDSDHGSDQDSDQDSDQCSDHGSDQCSDHGSDQTCNKNFSEESKETGFNGFIRSMNRMELFEQYFNLHKKDRCYYLYNVLDDQLLQIKPISCKDLYLLFLEMIRKHLTR